MIDLPNYTNAPDKQAVIDAVVERTSQDIMKVILAKDDQP